MITLKRGVRLLNINPHVAVIISVVGAVYASLGHRCVITSVNDGKHKTGSRHYDGMAVDFRLNDLSGIPPEERPLIASRVRAALGADFDVLHESPGTANEHLHVEYDPK